MDQNPQIPTNPLGLNLDFLFGRGYLWAKNERLNDWIELDHLRMEIPDLAFPFDARGGLHRFRNTRCLVREIEISTSEIGLADLARRAAADVHGFDSLEVHFLDGAIHVGARVKSLGAQAFISFRIALIPPEPARADEVHVSVYDYRAFGTLPFPARTLVSELLTRILSTPALRPPGRGDSFSIGIAGDILRMRPLKLLLLHLFPQVGWKLPNLSNVVLENAQIRPGRLTLRALSPETWDTTQRYTHGASPLTATAEGGRALAAYEAKDLFAHGDQAIFDRQLKQAIDLFSGYRDIYGAHPELVARLFDLLLSEPSPSNIAQAETLCRELEKEDPDHLHARLARPRLALLQGRTEDAIQAFERLAATLRQRGDTHDWILCQLSLAQHLEKQNPEKAAAALREILKITPRNRAALESLKAIYERESDTQGLEDVLKRLTGVYTDRDNLTATYLSLARHLMDRQGELAEARIYLERVLRLDPSQLEALHTLGQSYLLSEEPLRALKAFGSAARAAEARKDLLRAAQLHEAVAKIWRDHVLDPQQALLSARRALSLGTTLPADQRAELLLWTAQLCEEHERVDEAISMRVDAIALLEQAPGATPLLLDAHRGLARTHTHRRRTDASAAHWRRILEISPLDSEATAALESHYKMSGAPEQLLELYRDMATHAAPEQRAQLLLKSAEVYRWLGMAEEAAQTLEAALALGEFAALQPFVEILEQTRRFAALKKALQTLLMRVSDREPRWVLLIHLARTCLQHLAEPEQAARAYMEAIQLKPTQLEGLYGARDALERIVSNDYLAIAPIGDGPASKLLERLVARIAEVAPEPEVKREALIRLAELASLRGDMDEAKAASSRAAQLSQAGLEVDRRLDVLLQDTAETRTLAHTSDNLRPDALNSFRREFDKTIREPHAIPRLQELLKQDLVPKAQTPAPEAATEAPIAQVVATPAPATDLMQAIQSARSNQKIEELADALEELLEAAKNKTILLDPHEHLTYSRELGELLYYDLEASTRALEHLEYVRLHDPQGLGAEPGILNALESIYEEQGLVEGRIRILEDRLNRAESEEMDTVYRLLLAQLVWDEAHDREAATHWLSEILKRDKRHEAAHRLLADITRELEDWDATAEHLRTVLAVSSGGLDSVETERELAELLLLKLDRPRQAIQHLKHVLEAAPGDSRALEMLKKAQVSHDDWAGYADSLLLELGLLTGRPKLSLDGSTELLADSIPVPLRIPTSQVVSDLAHVAQHNLHQLEQARKLWKIVHDLWPEHVEALERRIDLDRALEQYHDLAIDLEAYADLLLDPHERFRCLAESARIQARHDEVELARVLFSQAIAVAESADSAPAGLDEVRRELQGLPQR